MTFGYLTRGKKVFQSNIAEIQSSPLLRRYGFALSLIHFFTFSYWFFVGEIYNQVSRTAPAFCQPFFQMCENFRFGTPELWRWILVLYFLAGVLGSFLWLKKDITKGFYFSIFVLLVKFFIYTQDYRLMGNYHYIHFIFIFLFLFVPNKTKVIPFSIVLIYLGAGILKLNNEWISGSALYGDIGPLRFIPIQLATIYVIVLELGISFLLINKKPILRTIALIQFFIFHFYSIQIVGLFYPAVMYCVLSIVVLMLVEGVRPPRFREILNEKPYVYMVLVFILAQAYPFILKGNSALTGEGRLLALNMFDAKAVCRNGFVIDNKDGKFQKIQLNTDTIGVRIRCEPYLYLEYGRRMCEDAHRMGKNPTIDIHLASRLNSETNFREIVNQTEICNKRIRFNPFFSNSWIEKEISTDVEVSPWFYKPANISSNAEISMYRENPQRTGVVSTESFIDPMSRPFWRKVDWNDSRHSASKSSPISDGKSIFVGSDRGYFSALDYSGKEQWRWNISADRGIHGSALIAGESVFWGDYEGVLYSVNKNDGSPNWILPLGQTIGSSPLYNDHSIYIAVETFAPPDGFVAKVDATTGKLIWKSPMLGEQAHSSPAMSEDGKLIYVGSNNGYLNALDSETGKIIWRYASGSAIKGTPLVADNSVIFCSWDTNLYRIDGKSGTLIWNAPLYSSCQSSAAWSKKQGLIYVNTSGGQTVAVEFLTGKHRWKHQGNGNHMSSPVLLSNSKAPFTEQLLATCFEKELCVFNPTNGNILRKINLGDRLCSVPWINNGELIYTLDTAGGLVRWK